METLREYSVNKFPDNPRGLIRRALPVVCALWLLAGLCRPAAAADTFAAKPLDGSDQKIRITSDRLVADTKTGSAEFIGNVRASQETTVITCDRLKILYNQNGENAATAKASASIKSLISTGNVVIHFDDKVATTDKAVYASQTGIFTLTGKGTKVTSGDNSITGEKITVDRKKDRITVEGGAGSRVKAVIFAGQDGLASPAPANDAAMDKTP